MCVCVFDVFKFQKFIYILIWKLPSSQCHMNITRSLNQCWPSSVMLFGVTGKIDELIHWILSKECSLQNKIWNLPDRWTILPKLKYDKEGKLAGPNQILRVWHLFRRLRLISFYIIKYMYLAFVLILKVLRDEICSLWKCEYSIIQEK